MNLFKKYLKLICVSLLTSCSGGNDGSESTYIPPVTQPTTRTINYLALGDSYTIGESVCETCRFPEQLKSVLSSHLTANYNLKIVARTGWTTTNLKTAIAEEGLSNNYDLVTLLIGVNNQYQQKAFSIYEQEFPELLATAIEKAKGDKTHVIVVSIPDYAYTPYGMNTGNQAMISAQIDQYNAFAKNYAEQNGVKFIDITPITREGLNNTVLVASDGLHPSQLAYAKFVELLFPVANDILQE
ncbi:SGNH/GDSL hydrolase family protein [Flavobacterium sp. 3HN19-14]|uniref:SGNH/GDSL hydrolase family protein n=1 Tax=Flavobacterium sp. 3HN19-14 TaxID=3448133 RepID=UPI003EE1C69E